MKKGENMKLIPDEGVQPVKTFISAGNRNEASTKTSDKMSLM